MSAAGIDAVDVQRQIERLKGQIKAARVVEREKADAELEHLGELAESAMRKALAGTPAPEVRRRLERLVEKLGGPVTSPDRLRALRAVEVLEAIGTPEARRVLEVTSRGTPEARLTTEARATLERLARQPAAGR